jgi:6-phosphogluconolactonase
MAPDVHRYASVQELSTAAAELVCQLTERCVEEHGYFTLALSGGSTPKTLYERLAQEPYSSKIPWMDTHLFWGDERYVPVNHADSNSAMASQALIEHVSIPLQNVHSIPTDTASPEIAAEQYETTLREYFDVFDPLSERKQLPVFDLILLGMGKDGHTASLFPDSPILDEQKRWVAATPVPKLNPPVRRITLTFPVINAAKTVLFLIAGAEKQPVVQTILESPEKSRDLYPTARVRPEDGKLLWFLA